MIEPPIEKVEAGRDAGRAEVHGLGGALGVNASVPGPVRLKPGELTVTVALLVPTR